MSLDPRAAAWLAMLNRIDAPRLHEMPVAQARHAYEKLMFAYRGEPEVVGAVEDLRIERREHAGGALTARLYRPADAPGPAPALLWLHGGGWCLGSLAAYDAWCRALTNACGRAVLALDYRLAPEHRFPAAVEDAWFALRWLAREASGLGLDASALALAGDSAGATLAAVLALWARDAAGPALDAQILLYPAIDLTANTPSRERYGAGHFLERESLAWFASQYFESPRDAADWRASPARATSHRGLPPTLMINAACDPLADEGRDYAAQLAAAQVPVRHVEYAGMLHGFAPLFSLFPQSRAALDEIAAALRAPELLESP